MFFDIFYELCKRKGVSCKRAAEEMGLSNSITTKWKKTGATPSGDTLQKVAEYFETTTDYLINGEETKIPLSEQMLTEEENVLLEVFRLIPPEQRRMFLDMGRAYANSLRKG